VGSELKGFPVDNIFYVRFFKIFAFSAWNVLMRVSEFQLSQPPKSDPDTVSTVFASCLY